jgi:GNAT superfamily N-acetyltransferase
MNKPQVIKTPAEWAPRAADLVAEANTAAPNQIGYYGDDPAEIRHFLLEETPEIMERSAIAVEDGAVVGFFGAECDAEVGRSWLFGPTVVHADPDDVADRMFEVLEPLLPGDAPEHELFFNVRNLTVQSFGERHGFGLYKDSEIMRFTRDALADLPAGDARPIRTDESSEIVALHDALFPAAPWTGRQIMERLGEHETVLVLEEGGRPSGYIHTRVNPAFPEGNIEFVGVTEAARGKGAGTRLVSSALRWMFSFDHIQETWLTVMDDNPGARRMYLKLGFDPVHTMRGMRRRVAS